MKHPYGITDPRCKTETMCTIIKLFLAILDYFQEGFVPYRDSVLTWLLKDNLGMQASFIFQKKI
jgi:hypothetical protein